MDFLFSGFADEASPDFSTEYLTKDSEISFAFALSEKSWLLIFFTGAIKNAVPPVLFARISISNNVSYISLAPGDILVLSGSSVWFSSKYSISPVNILISGERSNVSCAASKSLLSIFLWRISHEYQDHRHFPGGAAAAVLLL